MAAEDETTQPKGVSAPAFEDMVRRLVGVLNEYTGELSRRIADHERTAEIGARARSVITDAEGRIRSAVTELNSLSTRYTGVPASELPVVAYVEVVSRASSSLRAVSHQVGAIDQALQSTMAASRERAARAMQEVAHAASTFPQAVGSRAHEMVSRIEEQHNVTGRTGATVAALDERYRIAQRARELDERYGVSQTAQKLVERGHDLDHQYLGGRATRVASSAASAASAATEYVAHRTTLYREQQQQQGALPDAPEGEAAAKGKGEGEGEGEGEVPPTSNNDGAAATGADPAGVTARAAATASAIAQNALTRAAELDSRYGITASTVQTVSQLSTAVDSRLNVSDRAAQLDERYNISGRATGVLERAGSIDEQYLGGRAKAAWDSSVDYVKTRVAERAVPDADSDAAAGDPAEASQQPAAAAHAPEA